MSTAVVTVNKGVFRGLNLRQKTFLIIGFTSLLLLSIVISSLFVDGDSLPTDFGSKNLAPSMEHPFRNRLDGKGHVYKNSGGTGFKHIDWSFCFHNQYCADHNFRIAFKCRKDSRFLCILAGRFISFNPTPSFNNPYFHRTWGRSNRSYYWSCINALDKLNKSCKGRN